MPIFWGSRNLDTEPKERSVTGSIILLIIVIAAFLVLYIFARYIIASLSQ